MSPIPESTSNRHKSTHLNMRATVFLSWQACACRYVRESKVLFKVSGYADKALAGGEGAVSPHTPGGPHSAHGAPIYLVHVKTICFAATIVLLAELSQQLCQPP